MRKLIIYSKTDTDTHLNIIGWQKANGGVDFTFIPIFIDLTSNVNDIALFEAQLSVVCTISCGKLSENENKKKNNRFNI